MIASQCLWFIDRMDHNLMTTTPDSNAAGKRIGAAVLTPTVRMRLVRGSDPDRIVFQSGLVQRVSR